MAAKTTAKIETRQRLAIDAKIIPGKKKGDRYFVARYLLKRLTKYSYRYFLERPKGQLQKQEATEVVRELLDLPHATEAELATFYNQVWDDTVDWVKVEKLRANTALRAKSN